MVTPDPRLAYMVELILMLVPEQIWHVDLDYIAPGSAGSFEIPMAQRRGIVLAVLTATPPSP